MATRIRIKRGTESQITGYTGPHLSGELAYATNTGNVFVSDGTAFISIGGGGGETPTLQSVTDEGNTTTNPISAGTITANNELHLVNSAMRIFRSGDDMRFRTNNSDAMTIAANGNVGIGTTAPTENLEVAGNIISTWNNNRFIGIQFENGDAFKNGLVLKAGDRSTGLISKASNNNPYIWFGTGSEPVTERMRITDTGNVGIGTTSPSTPLEVYRSIGNDISILTLRGYSYNYGKFLEIYNPQGDNNTDTNLIFDISQSNASRGGVKLTSYGDVVNGSIPFNFVANSGAGGPGFVFGITNTRTGWGHTAFRNGAGTDNFTINSSGDIYARGNVGIGTTAPAAKLHVEGGGIFRTNTGTTPLYITRNGATTESLAIYTNDSGTIFETFQDETAAGYGSVSFKLDNGAPNTGFNITHGTSPMFSIGKDIASYIVNTGNVGIGTTSPAYKLHVLDSNPEVTTTPTSNGQYAGFSTEYGGEHRMFAGYIGTATQHGTSVATYFGSPAGYKVQIGRGGSTSITIDTSNRVGINTDAPAETLDVNGNVSADSYKIYNGSTALSTTGASVLTLNAGGFGRVGINSSGTETLTVSGGNVGIGTTAPSEKLHVVGDFKIGTSFTISAPGSDATISTGRFLTLNPSNSIKILSNIALDVNHVSWQLGNRNLTITSPGSGQFKIETVQDTIINPVSGDVGIGTTAPNSKVHISGTAMQQLRMETAGGPNSAGDTSGRIGDMAYDNDFFYIKTANGWGRLPLDFGF